MNRLVRSNQTNELSLSSLRIHDYEEDKDVHAWFLIAQMGVTGIENVEEVALSFGKSSTLFLPSKALEEMEDDTRLALLLDAFFGYSEPLWQASIQKGKSWWGRSSFRYPLYLLLSHKIKDLRAIPIDTPWTEVTLAPFYYPKEQQLFSVYQAVEGLKNGGFLLDNTQRIQIHLIEHHIRSRNLPVPDLSELWRKAFDPKTPIRTRPDSIDRITLNRTFDLLGVDANRDNLMTYAKEFSRTQFFQRNLEQLADILARTGFNKTGFRIIEDLVKLYETKFLTLPDEPLWRLMIREDGFSGITKECETYVVGPYSGFNARIKLTTLRDRYDIASGLFTQAGKLQRDNYVIVQAIKSDIAIRDKTDYAQLFTNVYKSSSSHTTWTSVHVVSSTTFVDKAQRVINVSDEKILLMIVGLEGAWCYIVDIVRSAKTVTLWSEELASGKERTSNTDERKRIENRLKQLLPSDYTINSPRPIMPKYTAIQTVPSYIVVAWMFEMRIKGVARDFLVHETSSGFFPLIDTYIEEVYSTRITQLY